MFLKRITFSAVVASLLAFAASDAHAGGFKISIGGGGKGISFGGGKSCSKGGGGCYKPTYTKRYYRPVPKPAPPLAKVPAGSVVSLPYIRYGNRPGFVVLSMPGVKLHAQVTHWEMNLVQVKLPELALAEPTKAQLMVVRSDGYRMKPVHMLLVPAPIAAVGQPVLAGTPAAAAAAAPAAGTPIILSQPTAR